MYNVLFVRLSWQFSSFIIFVIRFRYLLFLQNRDSLNEESYHHFHILANNSRIKAGLQSTIKSIVNGFENSFTFVQLLRAKVKSEKPSPVANQSENKMTDPFIDE